MELNLEGAKKVFNALVNAKIPLKYIKIIMAQSAFETGGFNDKKLYTLNNTSGITFKGNPNIQKNAVKGSPMPKNESKTGHYAKFNTLNDWAVDHWRIVKNNIVKSTSLADYGTRLKAQNYFTGPLPNYIKGLEFYYKKLEKNKLFEIKPNSFSETLKKLFPFLGILVIFALVF